MTCCFNFLLVLIVMSIFPLSVQGDVPQHTTNACQKRENYYATETRCEQEAYREKYKSNCLNVFKWFSCTKTRTAYRTVCEDVQVVRERITWECCTGYAETAARTCEPVCRNPSCVNGDCVSPDKCKCHQGYRGNDCSSECLTGTYGDGCSNTCECQNGAECDPVSGHCTCVPGFQGPLCEDTCSEWKHGLDCAYDCLCEQNNTGSCNHMTGACTCISGYQGATCNSRCNANTTGSGCNETCPCLNQGICLPDDAGCDCPTGWTGAMCGDPCNGRSWGPNCSNECKVCYNQGSCDRFTGSCLCLSGYKGQQCEQECDLGRWGQGCNQSCDCEFGVDCDFRNGTCFCNQFQSGDRCEILECPEGKYRSDCSGKCLCENNATCDMLTGHCTCLALGFTGPYCSQECFYGRYGSNCSLECNCTDDIENYFCHNKKGCLEIRKEAVVSEDTSSTPYIIVAVIVALLVIIGAGVAVAYFVRKYQRSKPKPAPKGYPAKNGFVNPVFNGDAEDGAMDQSNVTFGKDSVKYSTSTDAGSSKACIDDSCDQRTPSEPTSPKFPKVQVEPHDYYEIGGPGAPDFAQDFVKSSASTDAGSSKASIDDSCGQRTPSEPTSPEFPKAQVEDHDYHEIDGPGIPAPEKTPKAADKAQPPALPPRPPKNEPIYEDTHYSPIGSSGSVSYHTPYSATQEILRPVHEPPRAPELPPSVPQAPPVPEGVAKLDANPVYNVAYEEIPKSDGDYAGYLEPGKDNDPQQGDKVERFVKVDRGPLVDSPLDDGGYYASVGDHN